MESDGIRVIERVPLEMLGYYEIERLYDRGIIGVKEFRNWLDNYNQGFHDVRDPDVDAEIDSIARGRQQQLEQLMNAGSVDS